MSLVTGDNSCQKLAFQNIVVYEGRAMAHKCKVALDMMQGLSQGTQFPEDPNYPLNSPNLRGTR